MVRKFTQANSVLLGPLVGCSVVLFVGFAVRQASAQAFSEASSQAAGEQSGQQARSSTVTPIGPAKFTHSSEFELTLAAGEPLVHWPVVADFDSGGHLIVVESGGVSWPIQEHNKLLVHRIVRLIDKDRDGSFDTRQLVADKLPLTEGVLCLGNSMLVAAPPSILKLTDGDGDGFCEDREVWFDGQTVTNCANDLHGPYLGLDGWVYWCKGAFGEQAHELVSGETLSDSAAHIYRRRLDGGPIEVVSSGGMDNPVEVAFSLEGDKFFTSTFLHHPGGGLRDGIGHAIFGGVFGKDHHVVDDLVRTGPLLKPTVELGPAAPSGLMRLTPEHPLAGSELALVSALFNIHTVALHRFEPNGGGFAATTESLLQTERIDFHPTDVLEDADGSLLVIDTGGWYDLCCPTSRVDQDAAPGGIYRLSLIRGESDAASHKTDSAKRLSPWERRAAALRLIRSEAKDEELARIERVAKSEVMPLHRRQSAVWDLCKIRSASAQQAILAVLEVDSPPKLKQTCLAALAMVAEGAERNRTIAAARGLLGHSSLSVRRHALETLARLPDPASVDAILKSVSAVAELRELEKSSPALHHALVFALVKQIDASEQSRESVSRWLAQGVPGQQVLALKALAACRSNDALSESVAYEAAVKAGGGQPVPEFFDMLVQRPGWQKTGLQVLEDLANTSTWTGERAENFERVLQAWREEAAFQTLVASTLSESPEAVAISVVKAYRGVQLPAPIADELSRLLPKLADEKVGLLADELAKVRLADTSLEDTLYPLVVYRVAVSRMESGTEKLDVLTLKLIACLPVGPLDSRELEQRLVDHFVSLPDIDEATLAAVGRVQFSAAAMRRLVAKLKEFSPMQLRAVIAAAGRQDDGDATQLQRGLLEELPELAVATSLAPEFVEDTFRTAHAPIKSLAESIAARLQRPTQATAAELAKILAELPEGDSARGLEVFRSSSAACSACHQMGYIGQKIGPELTRIGGSRTREALLEAILFPSARIEQSFQPTKFLTESGEVVVGLAKRTSGSYEVQVSEKQNRVLDIDEIADMQPSELSIMPAGIRQVLSDQQLADVLQLLVEAK